MRRVGPIRARYSQAHAVFLPVDASPTWHDVEDVRAPLRTTSRAQPPTARRRGRRSRRVGLSRWRDRGPGGASCSPATCTSTRRRSSTSSTATGFAGRTAGAPTRSPRATRSSSRPTGGRTPCRRPESSCWPSPPAPPPRLTYLPRAKAMWAGPRWLPPGGDHPFAAEAELGPLELGEVVDPARRAPVVDRAASTDVEAMPIAHGDRDEVRTRPRAARRARARSGLRAHRDRPGRARAPAALPHRRGGAVRRARAATARCCLGDDGAPGPRGLVVARPAGTGVAHSFRRRRRQGLSCSRYGQRDPADAVLLSRGRRSCGVRRRWAG